MRTSCFSRLPLVGKRGNLTTANKEHITLLPLRGPGHLATRAHPALKKNTNDSVAEDAGESP